MVSVPMFAGALALVLAAPAEFAAEERLGRVSFPTSCAPEVSERFDRAVALLHSFWYEAAEAAFAEIATADPDCAMAHWGIAMTAIHPLWPDIPDAEKGREASDRARTIGGGTPREQGFIAAVSEFFAGPEPPRDPARTKAVERAMAALYERYPDDPEVANFYALALLTTAPPDDTGYTNQKAAAKLLDGLAPELPEHPGILHYKIHAYDSPEMAAGALESARRYSVVAASVPHGLHMSSHIFTRLGLWKEAVETNRGATSAGHDFASELGLPGAWDEELHAFEYLMYAQLQLGDDDQARRTLAELRSHSTGSPMSMKAAHPFAGAPARFHLERRQWKEAAAMEALPAELPWKQFPFAYAIVVHTRAVGSARSEATEDAARHVTELEMLRDGTESSYWSRQIEVLRLEASAWLAFAEGDGTRAEALLRDAVALEESMEKHPVTPGPLVPAREQLGELLGELGRPEEALTEIERSLASYPNRLGGLYAAGVAARDAGRPEQASEYFRALLEVTGGVSSTRPELDAARRHLERAR